MLTRIFTEMTLKWSNRPRNCLFSKRSEKMKKGVNSLKNSQKPSKNVHIEQKYFWGIFSSKNSGIF